MMDESRCYLLDYSWCNYRQNSSSTVYFSDRLSTYVSETAVLYEILTLSPLSPGKPLMPGSPYEGTIKSAK